MDSAKLKGKLVEHELSQKKAAEAIGVSLTRFNAKLNAYDGAEFSLGEVRALRDLLSLSAEQVDEIFLPKKYLEKVKNRAHSD